MTSWWINGKRWKGAKEKTRFKKRKNGFSNFPDDVAKPENKKEIVIKQR